MNKTMFPESLDNVIGNKFAIQEIKDAINSAKIRNDSIPHLLLTGPAGTGKTSISNLISKEMGSDFVYIMGASVSKKQNISLTLLMLKENDVVMIDEIHALDKASAETFYNAMLNFNLTIIDEENKVVEIPLNKFTLIGATTNPGLLKRALRQRFREIRIQLYSIDELVKILENYANIMNIVTEDGVITEIANRSRGTPRIARHFIEKIRDMVLSRCNRNTITKDDAYLLFKESNILEDGCNLDDVKYMEMIAHKNKNKPIGLSSISSSIDIDKEHIQSEIEPWLISLGYIERGNRGRFLTDKGLQRINLIGK